MAGFNTACKISPLTGGSAIMVLFVEGRKVGRLEEGIFDLALFRRFRKRRPGICSWVCVDYVEQKFRVEKK